EASVEGLVAAGRQASALLGPCLAVPPEIPVVDDEGELCCVDIFHNVREFLLLASVVGHVADQRKIKAGRARLACRPVGGATAEQQHERGNDQGGGDSHGGSSFSRT